MQRILFALAICLLFTIPLRAQAFPKRVTIQVGGGFSFPLAPVANHTETGFNFVASAGPRFNRQFSLALDFGLHYFEVNNSFLSTQSDIIVSQGSMMRMWSLTLNPAYEFVTRERFSSYVTGGYGLYNRKLLLASPGPAAAAVCDDFWEVCVSSMPATITGDLSQYKGGYNAGGGLTFGARTKFFIEARYHHMFTANAATEVVPLSFGIRW